MKKAFRKTLQYLVRVFLILFSIGSIYLVVYLVFAPEREPIPVPDSLSNQIINLDGVSSFRLLSAVEQAEADSGNAEILRDLRTRKSEELSVVVTKVFVLKGYDPSVAINLYVSGDEAGQKPWFVSDLLLLETFVDDSVYSQAVIGNTDGLETSGDGFLITRLGRKTAHFSPKEVNIGSLIPKRDPVILRVSALTYGSSGQVSDVYLIVD